MGEEILEGGGEENVTHARVGAAPSMSEILPRLEEMRMTLEEGVERRGYRVWKAWIGRRVLDSKCASTLGSGVWRVGRKVEPRPALRTRTSIWVMECDARVVGRVLALSLGMERDSV